MSSSSVKRAAAAGLVLIAALIFWKTRKLSERPPVPVRSPVTAKTEPLLRPAPVQVTERTTAPKRISPKKPPLRPLRPAIATKPGAPAAQVPMTLIPLPTPPPPVPHEWQGNDTAVTHPGEVVIRTDHQWIQFWAEHHPDEAAPEVDFTQAMVIGVFAGPRPADQFTIRIVDIRPLSDSLTVDYQERLPPPGTFAVNVTVYPYQLKVIPRTTLPVKFNKLAPINPNR